MQMLYERMEKDAAEADEPETEARRRAMDEEEALLKVTPFHLHPVHLSCIKASPPLTCITAASKEHG